MREDHGEPECVEFQGVTYSRWPDSPYKHLRRYFSPGLEARLLLGTESLHREVWKAAHGPIPAGHLIHHVDTNPLNNDVSNLACVTVSEHGLIHAADPDRAAQLLALAEIGRRHAPEWHRSEEGRQWHREHGLRTWEGREPEEMVCAECGESAKRHFVVRASTRFCSRVCSRRAADRERRYEHRVPCPMCGESFWQSKYRPKPETCSRMCGAALRRERLPA